MRLYVGVPGSGPAWIKQAEWDGDGAFAGLLRTVAECTGYREKPLLYYVDLSDADEIVVRTDDDVSEFLDHHIAAQQPPKIYIRPASGPPPDTRELQQPRRRTPMSAPPPGRDQSGSPVARRAAPCVEHMSVGRRKLQWSRAHLLGAGATAQVFKAFDKESGDFFAVKEMLLQGNEDNLRSVKREIELMKPLQHENIVRYTGIQQTTTALHILMEYVAGGSISSLLFKLGAFAERVIRCYTKQICLGLEYLHSNNILHRDIKGGNCLVSIDGTVKLADFGCSVRVLSTESGIKPPRSLVYRNLGTSLWMSPESVRNPSDVGFSADIWSVGCTVVEMADGRAPWADANFTNEWAAMFYISQTTTGPPVPRTLSRQSHRLLQRCFAVDPEQRPSVGQILEDGFITEPFDEANPQMAPPSPSELAPAPTFPERPDRGGGDEEGLVGVASVASFTPMDLGGGWRNLEEDDTVLCAHDDDGDCADDDEAAADDAPLPDDAPAATPPHAPPPSESPHGRRFAADLPPAGDGDDARWRLPQITSPLGREPPLPRLRRRDWQEQEEGAPAAPVVVADTPDEAAKPQLVSSAKDITDFLRDEQRESPPQPAPDRSSILALSDGLLFAILSFLEHQSLCRAGRCCRQLQRMSAHDTLVWQPLFCSVFGEVSDIQCALRTNWKQYYVASQHWAKEVCGGRYRFVRKLCYSSKVYEGTDGDARVVIKVEPVRRQRLVCSVRSPASQYYGPTPRKNGGRPPSMSTPTKGRSAPGRPRSGKGMTGYTGPLVQGSPMKNLQRQLSGLEDLRPGTGAYAGPVSMWGGGNTPRTGSPAGAGIQAVMQRPSTMRLYPAAPVQAAVPAALAGAAARGGAEARAALVPASPPLPLPLPASRSPSKRQWPRRTATSPVTTPPQLTALSAAGQIRAPHLAPLAGGSRPALSADDAQSLMAPTPPVVPDRQRLTAAGLLTTAGAPLADSAGSDPPRTVSVYEYRTEQDARELRRQEERKQASSCLVTDFRFAKELSDAGVPGVLQPLWHGPTGRDAFLATVMPEAGPSLNDYMLFGGNRFNCKTVYTLAVKAIRLLRAVHEHGVVHCNVTPMNLLMGSAASRNELVLVNWGSARHWRDCEHRRSRRFVGSAAQAAVKIRGREQLFFVSPMVQTGCTPGPRDDLVSVAYCLFYFMLGSLPWLGAAQVCRRTAAEARTVLAKKKDFLKTTVDVRPVQLHRFLSSVSSIKAHEKPDYAMYEDMFLRMLADRGYGVDDDFDWCKPGRQESTA